MKENIKCQNCYSDYYVEWFEEKIDDYDDVIVPDYCPFCGAYNVEVDEDLDVEE